MCWVLCWTFSLSRHTQSPHRGIREVKQLPIVTQPAHGGTGFLPKPGQLRDGASPLCPLTATSVVHHVLWVKLGDITFKNMIWRQEDLKCNLSYSTITLPQDLHAGSCHLPTTSHGLSSQSWKVQRAALLRDSAGRRYHHLLNTGLGTRHASSPFTFTPALDMGTVVTSIL